MPDLRERAAAAADVVADCDGLIRCVSHYDADGLAAGAVLARTLRRAGTAFSLSIVRRLDADVVDDAAEDADLLVFADMGSGDPGLFDGVAERTVVLDHHAPAGEDPGFAAHVNAHLGGVDGSFEASAASVAFLWATALDEANWDLFPIALAGVVGDRQDRPELAGLNAELAEQAVERGIVRRESAPRLAGGPLVDAVASATDPFLVGLSGDRDAAEAFLDGLGLPPDAAWTDLDEEAGRRLVSTLSAHLLDQGCRPELVRELVGSRFAFDGGPGGDAWRLAELLNAAGRSGSPGDGLAFLLGQSDLRERLSRNASEHRERVLEEATRVVEAGADVRDAIQVVEVEEATLTGTIAGLGMSYVFDPERATVSLYPQEGEVKVSTRGTRHLVDRGLDLAAACRDAARKAGGSGGGHPVAAGATVPSDQLETFLDALDRLVGDQIGGSDA